MSLEKKKIPSFWLPSHFASKLNDIVRKVLPMADTLNDRRVAGACVYLCNEKQAIFKRDLYFYFFLSKY